MQCVCLLICAFVALVRTYAAAQSGASQAPASTASAPIEPLVRIVDLDAAESQSVVLSDGRNVRVRLVDVSEERDEINGAVREARVRVEVDGEAVTLHSGNYNLPKTVGAAQIDSPCTAGYADGRKGNAWGLLKAARLRLWPAGSPWMKPETFDYPVRQRWFASATQMGNEPVYVDGGDIPAARGKVYYHSGSDFGGVEGMVDVVAACEGRVVCAGREVLPDHASAPVEARYDVVYVLDRHGWYERYSHLQSIDSAVRPGMTIKRGQKIGVLGKEGGSGGWSHLHFDIISRQPTGLPSAAWGVQDAYAYVWEAYQRQYQPRILAVARPHRLAWTGQTVRLDASKSWSAAGKIVRYEWTCHDGQKASGPILERVYSQPGTYSEVVKVTDAEGAVAYDFAPIQILDREHPDRLPPTIHVACAPTQEIRAGEPVTFKVRSFRTKKGGETLDFGDGSPSVSVSSDGNAKPRASDGYASAVHIFKRPGDYLVRAEHESDFGRAVMYLHVPVWH